MFHQRNKGFIHSTRTADCTMTIKNLFFCFFPESMGSLERGNKDQGSKDGTMTSIPGHRTPPLPVNHSQ